MQDQYLSSLIVEGKSPATIRTYRLQISKFFKWMEQHGSIEDPREITSVDAADYRNWLQAEGKLPRTVNTALASIEAFCCWMVDQGYIDYNPVAKVRRVEQVEEAPKWLNRSERGRLIRFAEREKDIRNTAVILTLLMSGLRAAELCELKHDDIVIGDRKGSIIVRKGKGNKRRVVPIERDLRHWLSKYIANRHPTGDWLFPSQRGNQLTYMGVYQLCQAVGNKAEMDNLTPHMLRHTFGHELAVRGVQLQIIQKLMGHSKMDSTAVYIQPGEEELQAAVEKLSFT